MEMKKSSGLKTVLLSSLFLISAQSLAEEVIQIKDKRFLFSKEKSQQFTKGEKVKFKDNRGKTALIAEIDKCGAQKCIATLLKRRKGFELSKGIQIFSQVQSSAPVQKMTIKKEKQEKRSDESGTYKYAVKGGVGGQNSASFFGEFDYISNEKWTYGLVFSSRYLSRDDLEIASTSFGVRADYHFNTFKENGFLASVNLGMANVTYTVVSIEDVSNFEESESVPYFTAMAAYKMWFGNLYATVGGGLSYMGYKDKFDDPNSTSSFTNPYSSIDLAFEASLAYPF